MSLKLLAEQLLLGCPNYRKPSGVSENLKSGPSPSLPLYVAGELTALPWEFRPAITVYVSKHNPGAEAFAEELSALPGYMIMLQRPKSFRGVNTGTFGSLKRVSKAAADTMARSSRQLVRSCPAINAAVPVDESTIGGKARQLVRQASAQVWHSKGDPTHMLLYLNQQ